MLQFRVGLLRFSEVRTMTPSLMTSEAPLKSFLPISPDFTSKEAKISFLLTDDKNSGLELKFGPDLEAKNDLKNFTFMCQKCAKDSRALCILFQTGGCSYK